MEEVVQEGSSISRQGKSETMAAAGLRISKTLLICLGFLIFGLLECSKGPALLDFSELMNVDLATISYLFITRSVGQSWEPLEVASSQTSLYDKDTSIWRSTLPCWQCAMGS